MSENGFVTLSVWLIKPLKYSKKCSRKYFLGQSNLLFLSEQLSLSNLQTSDDRGIQSNAKIWQVCSSNLSHSKNETKIRISLFFPFPITNSKVYMPFLSNVFQKKLVELSWEFWNHLICNLLMIIEFCCIFLHKPWTFI